MPVQFLSLSVFLPISYSLWQSGWIVMCCIMFPGPWMCAMFSRPGRGSHCHRRKCCHFILKIVFLAYRTTTAMNEKIGRGEKVEQVVWQACFVLGFCSSISVVKWYSFIMWCMYVCMLLDNRSKAVISSSPHTHSCGLLHWPTALLVMLCICNQCVWSTVSVGVKYTVCTHTMMCKELWRDKQDFLLWTHL